MLAGAVSLGALFLDMETVASFISFGALVAFSAVNLSVIAHFLVRERVRSVRGLLGYGLVPGIGLAFTVYLWTNLSGLAFAVGGVWMLAGLARLAWLTRGFRRRPPVLDLDGAADGTDPGTDPGGGPRQDSPADA